MLCWQVDDNRPRSREWLGRNVEEVLRLHGDGGIEVRAVRKKESSCV